VVYIITAKTDETPADEQVSSVLAVNPCASEEDAAPVSALPADPFRAWHLMNVELLTDADGRLGHDNGGFCAKHRRCLSFPEQRRGACSWCVPVDPARAGAGVLGQPLAAIHGAAVSHQTSWKCRTCGTTLGTVRNGVLRPLVPIHSVDGQGVVRVPCPKCGRIRVWEPSAGCYLGHRSPAPPHLRRD